MDLAGTPIPSFGRRFWLQFLRWLAWLVAIGVGFHGGELIASLTLGPQAALNGMVIFVTGVLAYAMVGLILGGLIALGIAARTHTLPQTRRTWIVAALIAGGFLLIGAFGTLENPRNTIGFGNTAHAAAASPCTSDAIAIMFADFQALDATPNGKKGASLADKLARDTVVCDAQSGVSLSERDHGTYIDAFLFGAGDSAYAYYSVARYHDSRVNLERYQTLVGDFRKIAEMKGWKAFLHQLDALAPVMHTLDDNLRAKGY